MADIPSSSITVFKQSTAITGWTKLTSLNDCTLRIVSGTVSSGGTRSFTDTFTTVTPTGSVTASGTTGSVSLAESEIPSHTHVYSKTTTPAVPTTMAGKVQSPSGTSTLMLGPRSTFTYNMTSSGLGGSHSHPISATITSPGFAGNNLNFNIKYVDVILAQRN